MDFRETLIKTLETIQSRVDNMNKKYMATYVKLTGSNDRVKELNDLVKKLNAINQMVSSVDNNAIKLKCFVLVPSINSYINEYLNFYNKLFNSKLLDTKISGDMSISKATQLMGNYFKSYDENEMNKMKRSMTDIGKLVKDLHSPNSGFDFITKAMRKDLSKFTNNRVALKNGLFNLEVKKLKKINVTSKADMKKVLSAMCDSRRITDLPFIYNEIIFGMKHVVEYATELLKEVYDLKGSAYEKDVVPTEFDINFVVAQAMNICIILEDVVSEYEALTNIFYVDFDGLLRYANHITDKTIEFLSAPDDIKDNHFMTGDVI